MTAHVLHSKQNNNPPQINEGSNTMQGNHKMYVLNVTKNFLFQQILTDIKTSGN